MAKVKSYEDVQKARGKAVRQALKGYAMDEKIRTEQEELENAALKNAGMDEETRDRLKKEQEEYKTPKEKGFWGKLGDLFKGTETRAGLYTVTAPTPIKKEPEPKTITGDEADIAPSDIEQPTGGMLDKTEEKKEEKPKGVAITEGLRKTEDVTKNVVDYDIDKATDKAISNLKEKYTKVDSHLRERLPKTIIGAYRQGFGTNATPKEIKEARNKLSKNIKVLDDEYNKKIMDVEFEYSQGKMKESEYQKALKELNDEKKARADSLTKEYNDTYGKDDVANRQALFYFISDAIAKGLKGFKVAGAQGGGGEVEKPAYQEMLETNLAKGLESYNRRFDSEMDSIISEIKGSQEEKDRIRNTFAELYADESLKPVLQNLSVYNKKRLANILREYGQDVSIGDVATAAKGAFLLESGTSPETVKNLLSGAGSGAMKIGGLLMGGK